MKNSKTYPTPKISPHLASAFPTPYQLSPCIVKVFELIVIKNIGRRCKRCSTTIIATTIVSEIFHYVPPPIKFFTRK